MTRPIRISIHALGGQGGGVLSGWLVDLATHEGWTAQATSVPGVAQRTGATVYYVELAPPGPEPVLALMPTPGDVDLVLAAELMEAGRAIARGLVTPDRTTLVASSHRVFAIGEKMALGDGAVPPARVLDAARVAARRLVLADLAAIAEAEGAIISAPLLGALAGSEALPFPREAFAGAIRRGGKGVERSLRAFDTAYAIATGAASQPRPAGIRRSIDYDHAVDLPEAVRPLAQLGIERLRDYQDAAHAGAYLRRLDALHAADRALGGAAADWSLTSAGARHLARWMSWEDSIRVADLKTRPQRLGRVRAGAGARDGHLLHATEFLHPRWEEVCDSMPAKLGARLRTSPRARRWGERLIGRGRFVHTTAVHGYLFLWSLARLRRFRPHTLRYHEEMARIDAWLESAVNAARESYGLGVEVIRLQRLVKGYSDTHARGLHNFARLLGVVPELYGRVDGATLLRELHEAALADDEGAALGKALRGIGRRTGLALAA